MHGWYITLTSGRPVLDVSRYVHYGILVAVTRRSQSVALAYAHRVRGRHGIDGHLTDLHANDETAPRAHAHSHGS